jgi:hypothetical protein
MLERSDTLCERRGRGIDPAQVRNSMDLPLENDRVDHLPNRDPKSAAYGLKLQNRKQIRRRAQGSHT